MSVFKSPYETTICTGFILNKLHHEIEKAFIDNLLFPLESGNEFIPVNQDIFSVKSDGPGVSQIPTFVHPITVESRAKNKLITIADVRTCTRYNQMQGVANISNNTEYNFISLRAHLTHLWIEGDREVFLNISKAPINLYSRWLSENITRRFGLDPNDQLTIAILAAYFYICLFYDDEDFNEHDRLKIASLISKSVYCSSEMALDIITPIKPIKNIKEFAEVVKDVTSNVRLNDFNHGLIFSMVGNGWYGISGYEILCTALEHPPTWMALVQAAYNDRAYKKTSIGNLAARDKPDVIKSYTHGLFSLIRIN